MLFPISTPSLFLLYLDMIHCCYTHYEVVLGISGLEFTRNFGFSIEQNQRLSYAVVAK